METIETIFKNLFETLKVILPAITAGLFTFFITKYTYNKNRPLDKLEIAYNRIYYPIYKMISDDNLCMDEIINKCNTYILKYNKYVDISTKKIFELLYTCTKKAKKKSIYKNFKDNIYNRNSYLRRRLGYLEPNFAQLYKYAEPGLKLLFRITIGMCILYVTLILCSITINISETIFSVCVTIFTISLLWIIVELIWCFLRFLYYKIRK